MSKKTTKAEPAKQEPGNFIFRKNNYQLLIIGMLVILAGYLLMLGDENIMSFRKISLAPMVILGGFIVFIIGILSRPKDQR